jgi:type I restriction enzyme S subunit
MEQWKEYKETEFGKIPNSWDVATIKEETKVVVDYVANGSFASLAENVKYKTEEDYAVLIRLVDYNNNYNGNFVFIDKEAYEFLGKSKLFGDEIIISNVGANVGTVFKCPRLKYKMSLAPNSIMVKFKGNNDFYYYWLKSPFGQHMLHSIVTGSAQPKFNKTNFREMSIPVPPIEIQEKIAQLLKPLDEKIEVNKQINSNFEEQAKALFNSWFIDFEPFKGGKFVDSELGKIPEGWNMMSFESIISESQDKAMVGTYPAYSVTNNGIIPRTEKFKKRLSKATSKEKILRKDDLVFGMSRQILNWGIMQDEIGSVSSAYHVYKIDKERTDPTYLRYFIKGYETYFRDLIGTAAREGQSLDKGALMNKKLLVPSKDVLCSFIQHVTTIENAISLFKSQCRWLSTLRDTLLPRLMSGEIEVRS